MFEYYQIYWIKIHYFSTISQIKIELNYNSQSRNCHGIIHSLEKRSLVLMQLTSNRWCVEMSSWKQFEIPPQKTEKSCKQIVYLRSRKYTKLKTGYSSPSFSCKAKRIVFQRGNEIQENMDVFKRLCVSTRIARETLANITIFQIPWEKQSKDFMEIGILNDCLVIVQFQTLEIRRYVDESSNWR